MAKIVDRLVVMLGLDSSGYEAGRKKVDEGLGKTREGSEKTRKQWEKDTNTAVAGFAKIRNQILGIGAAYLGLGAIKNFTKDLIEQDIATGYLARNVGMSIEQMSRWQQAARRMGSDAADIGQAFRVVRDMAEGFKLGIIPQGISSGAFAKAGVDISKMLDAQITPEEKMLELARAFSLLSNEQAQVLGQQAGFTEKTLTMLHQGIPAIQAMLASVPDVLTPGAFDAERQMDIRLENIKDRFKRFGRELVDILGPPLLALGEKIEKWFLTPNRVREITTEAKHLVSVMEGLVPVVSKFADSMGEVAEGVGGWGEAIKLASAFALGGPKGVAAVLGWDFGSAVNKKIEEHDSKGGNYQIGNEIGEWVARFLAAFGNKEAEHDVRVNNPDLRHKLLSFFEIIPEFEYRLKKLNQENQRKYDEWKQSQQSVTIGTVVIQTNATDSKGIARDFNKDLSTVMQSNSVNR